MKKNNTINPQSLSIPELIEAVNAAPARSAWGKGVKDYAEEILDALDEDIVPTSEADLLNGADGWEAYSWGGCSLIYDGDIAARLCTPSELRRTNNGAWRPNPREDWLDVQARALFQAAQLIARISRSPIEKKPRTYAEKKAAARAAAIEWQQGQAEGSLSYGEYAAAAEHFERLGRRYGLLQEFRENGII